MLTRARCAVAALALMLGACRSVGEPIATVERVDLPRFMGEWYVIASIPTALEKNAFNALESYRLGADGTVKTTFTFREGGFDGATKTYRPTGFVRDRRSNAVWGMQFIWPIKADYRIAYLDEAYSRTIIARNRRDYVWIMARSPNVDAREYDELVNIVSGLGYDVTKLRRVPQRWN